MKLKDLSKEHLNRIVELKVLIAGVALKRTKSDKVYADVTIQDSTKSMETKCWDYEQFEEVFEGIKDGQAALIKGLVGEYNDQIQLTIREIRPMEEGSYDPGDFIRKSDWDLAMMEKSLGVFYDKIHSEEIKELIDRLIFAEPYYSRFITYPAAKMVHHNFYHGILQHTLEVLKYAVTVAGTKKLTQKQMDRLIAIGLLHDWAKIKEYHPLPKLELTDEGMMLGHIFLGAYQVEKEIESIEGFSEEDRLVILNGILGHHGALEFGSPVLPKTVEAQILHQADKLSGDIESILQFTEDHHEEESSFTPKLWNMGTGYYKG